jgi:hypothetical protein
MRSLAFTIETDMGVLSRGNAASRQFQRDVRLRRRSREVFRCKNVALHSYVIVCELCDEHEMFERGVGEVYVVAMRGV